MTIRKALENQFKKDMETIPKYVINQNGLKLIFDAKRGLYVGIQKKKDGTKKEWIEAIQHTKVAIFWIYCPNEIERNGFPVKCNIPNMTLIYEEGKEKKCTGCGKPFKVEITVTKDQPCYDLLEEIKKDQG